MNLSKIAHRPRRTTHHHDGELVVFLIGMRFSKPWRIDAWLPAFTAMPKMVAELSKDPESGLLGYRLTIGGSGPVVVQYWASLDKLYGYAGAPEAEHRPAWAAFNRRARRVPGAVGIWHETYVVERAESMYVDMPVAGLAAATSSVPVTKDKAKERISVGITTSRVPSPVGSETMG